MKSFTLFLADQRGNERNKLYPHRFTVNSTGDLVAAAQYDHVCALYQNNSRSNDRFICADVLPLDLDNDHSDDPAAWKDLDDVKAAFPGVSFYAVESRNHMKSKNGKSPRPKFHCYFAINATTDAAAYADLKRRAIAAFPWFDKGAADAARFLFGVENPKVQLVECNGRRVDEYLVLFGPAPAPYSLSGPAELHKPETENQPFVLPEVIPCGERNTVLFKYACQLRARGLNASETRTLLEVANERCEIPVEPAELDTILQSAGRYEYTPQAIERAATMLAFTEVAEKTKTAPVHTPNLVCANDIPYEPPRWAFAPYFQRGKGTLIQGDNGSGKTAFMMGVIAHISTGKPLLGMEISTPGDVLILSVEDDLPVLRGRLEANGADLARCHFITDAAGYTFNSPEIEAAIRTVNAKLILFDPLQAFLGARVDMSQANETRPELAKLFAMCDRNDCACAIISHMGKARGDKSPVNRSLGSVDIPAAMRSILELADDPMVDGGKVMVHVKCSNAPRGPSIAYRIVDLGGVHWSGISTMTPDDLMVVNRRKEKGTPYESEPLVAVFKALMNKRPAGGFWSYSEVKTEGAKILGFPPFDGVGDLRRKLDSGLSRELQTRENLIVSHGVIAHGNSRGIRIDPYKSKS